MPERRRALLSALILLLVVGAVVLPALMPGRVLFPDGLAAYVSPWSGGVDPASRAPWDPLAYDSIGQFLPWRIFLHQSVAGGRLPLWNPWQFCGAPFAANSQSAILYPGSLLYAVLPAEVAMAWSALLHLLLAAFSMYALLRRAALCRSAAWVGAAVFALSAWQLAWLPLPTFLCTSAWFPVVMLTVQCVAERPSAVRVAGLGGAVGMMLLAGHLQIAFYGLLVAVAQASFAALGLTGGFRRRGRALVCIVTGLLVGFAVASPQLLPALELSRRSHRAGAPSTSGYAAYTGYAPEIATSGALLLPDWAGGPMRSDRPYTGRSRAGMPFSHAEGALYVGLLPLILLAVALPGLRRRRAAWPFLSIAAVGLLLGFGTPVNAALYFGLPGFGQSGAPGRAFCLWSLGAAGMASIGAHALVRGTGGGVRRVAWSVGGILLLCATAAGIAVATTGGVLDAAGWAGAREFGLVQQAGLLVLALGLVGATLLGRLRARTAAPLLAALVGLDLLTHAAVMVRTTSAGTLYARRPSVDWLRDSAGHDRVLPLNRRWSFAGPDAALAPNAAMAVGLRDVQGYDSLFPGAYKQMLRDRLGADPSPPEVGNMLFVPSLDVALLGDLGVRCVASRAPLAIPGAEARELDGLHLYRLADTPGRAVAQASDGSRRSVRWITDTPAMVSLAVGPGAEGRLSLSDQRYPGWHAYIDGNEAPIEPWAGVFRSVRLPAGQAVVSFRYLPASFRIGLFLLLAAAVAGSAALARALFLRHGEPDALSSV